MSNLPTGTLTFLVADIEGSTRLVQEAGPRYPEILGSVRAILREAIVEHDGVEVDATGDELLAVFGEPASAIEAAVAAQRTGQFHQWPDARVVRFRVGVHTGLAEVDDEGYVGIDIIRASRIASAGHGGQILLSSTSAGFASGFEVRDLGLHQLAGLAEPERIHQLLGDGLPRDFPPLRNTVSQLGAGRRVVIAEDTVLLREGVVRLLHEAGFEVVAQSGNGDDLMRHVAMHKPDVAIVDIRMPPTHTDEGLRAAHEIRKRFPETGVLVLSQYVEPAYAFDLLADGSAAVGYLLKDRVSDLEEFATSVRRVADGGSALDPEVVAQLLGRRKEADPLETLTPREREVLELMAEGRSNQAIADRLYITLRAVEKHVTSIFTKLDLPASSDDHRRVLAVLAYLRD